MATSYALSAWFFTRALAAVYCIAFLSLAAQTRGLWGAQGVLPIGSYLQEVERQTDLHRYWQLPSLFWLGNTDTLLVAATWLGTAAALAAFLGFAQGLMLLICFALYLSFVSAGQDFMSFQWDALLLESGFLALFVVPWALRFDLWTTTDPHWSVRALFYLLIFKLMFLSGVVKILSGDPAWRDFSALKFHYWTQPLPNPISPFMHFLPVWFHRIETVLTFAIELICPFLLLWPRARLFVAAAFIGLSLMIGLTGNYTFFNLLTIVLCFWLIPDYWWEKLADLLPWPITENPAALFTHPAPGLAMTLLAALSLYWCVRFWIPDSWNERLWPVIRVVQSFHLSNPYGLFATMTKSRPEIILEGSDDGKDWKEYGFHYKPGNLYHILPVVAPHQPRLDWQMWFAALGSYRENYFVQNLMVRVMQQSPEVMAFFSVDPFSGRAPKYIRARLYAYEFTSINEILNEGKWWKRDLLGDYSPILKRGTAAP